MEGTDFPNRRYDDLGAIIVEFAPSWERPRPEWTSDALMRIALRSALLEADASASGHHSLSDTSSQKALIASIHPFSHSSAKSFKMSSSSSGRIKG